MLWWWSSSTRSLYRHLLTMDTTLEGQSYVWCSLPIAVTPRTLAVPPLALFSPREFRDLLHSHCFQSQLHTIARYYALVLSFSVLSTLNISNLLLHHWWWCTVINTEYCYLQCFAQDAFFPTLNASQRFWKVHFQSLKTNAYRNISKIFKNGCEFCRTRTGSGWSRFVLLELRPRCFHEKIWCPVDVKEMLVGDSRCSFDSGGLCANMCYLYLLWRCIEDIGRFIQIQKQWNATYTAYTIRRMCMIFTSSVTKPLWTMHILPYCFGPGESCTPPDAALTCADRAGEAENWKRNEFKLKHQLLHVSPWGSHLSCSQCQPHWFYLGSVQLVYICLHDVWEFHGVSRVSVKECWDSNPPFEFEHRRNTYTKSYKNQNSQQLSLRSWSPVATRKSGDQRFAIGWLPHGCSLARSGMEEIHRTSQYPNIFQQYGGTLRHTQILAWWSMILCTGLLQTLLPLTQFFFEMVARGILSIWPGICQSSSLRWFGGMCCLAVTRFEATLENDDSV